jgi:hypothetical protein
MNRSAKLLWIAFAILVPLGMLWQFYPLKDASARLDAFPMSSVHIDSKDFPLTPAEIAIYSNVKVVKRIAQVGNDRAFVTIIDGTKNRHAVHDPVYCFRGAGWTVSSQEDIPMDHGVARLVHLQQDKDTAEALYWFSDGATQFDRPLLYWWKTALRRLTFGKSGNEPVLVVLSSVDGVLPDWPAVLKAWPELQTL